MEIEYDENKRLATLENRELDFASAELVFQGKHFSIQESRQNYGEDRFITAGFLDSDLVVLVWTPRDNKRRIISMRKANEREQKRFWQYLG